MSQDAPPRAGGSLNAPPSVLRDEDALRRAFDRHFDALFADAVSRLGADAAHLAPRIVEQTFVHAWHERAHIATEADLPGYLAEDVQHRCARALSRRNAAHRLGHHNGEKEKPTTHAGAAPVADPALAWDHILHVLHSEAHEAEARAQAAKVAHHEAATHIKEVAHGGNWVRNAIGGAAVLAAAVGAVWVMDRVAAGAKLEAAVTANAARTIESRPGQFASLELAEGTKVRLAPESQLFVPQEFGEELRGVRVEGAARIEVAPGIGTPLTIFARNVRVSATGTVITIRSYKSDAGVFVRLDEGTASLRVGEETRAIAPGEALFIPDSAPPRAATAGELAEGTSWVNGVVSFHDRRLGEVLPDFSRWYRMRIHAANQATLDRRVSFRAPIDSVRVAIAAVEREAGVQFGYMGENMVFIDTMKATAKKP